MLSRAQEAWVLEVLGDCASGTLRTYCLEHLAAAVRMHLPPALEVVGEVPVFLDMNDFGQVSVQERERALGGCDPDGHIVPVQDEHMMTQT